MRTRLENNSWRHRALAFGAAVPIAILGGLIGLGGAEFRLPVLAGPLGYSARQAVPLNLLISLITISVAILTRGYTLSLEPLAALLPAMIGLILGGVVTAFLGTMLVHRLTDAHLERIVLVLLIGIGSALIVEGFLPQSLPPLVPAVPAWQVVSGIILGLGIGLVSSLLGVAGGELIIPTLIFVFGADIKIAGSASLFVSLPIVLVGVLRYAQQHALSDQRALQNTVTPMGLGSILGAVIGGSLVGVISASVLKVGLGLILIFSAFRIFREQK